LSYLTTGVAGTTTVLIEPRTGPITSRE
jgi:hypothetical protein